MSLLEFLLFATVLVEVSVQIFLLIYFLITLSDFESDYLNAKQCCTRMNRWVSPTASAQGLMTALLLLDGHWLLFILNAPVLGWMIFEIRTIKPGNRGLFDPSELCEQFGKYVNRCVIFLGYYLVLFAVSFYSMIETTLEM